MNAYLNQVIQQFQYGRLGVFVTPEPTEVSRHVREWFRESVDCTPYLYWDRLIEFPAQEDEEIRFLHEEYNTELHECDYCVRLYEAERDMDGWFDSQYCEDCYWDLNGEGRD